MPLHLVAQFVKLLERIYNSIDFVGVNPSCHQNLFDKSRRIPFVIYGTRKTFRFSFEIGALQPFKQQLIEDEKLTCPLFWGVCHGVMESLY